MKIFKWFSEVKHMLELLIQKEELDVTLPFYDDGQRYYVFTDNPPDYLPKYDRKGYVYFSGPYGECVKQYNSYGNKDNIRILSEQEYETR